MSSRGLPAGTVTFVFTDLEGSTRLLDRLGAGYAQLLDQHNRILIDAFTRHGGVVFGTAGDAMFVAFERATAAIAAVVDAQLGLQAAAWPDDAAFRVRMGVHTGEVDVVGDNYVGMSLHVAARIAAAGHGGQVLVSEVTRRLVPDVAAMDLGSHHLKDVGEVGIWQLTHPSLARDFPPLRTLKASNNLPAPVDSFIGRRAELAEVLDALRDCRLVTLTGSGGSGKTRLALEAATAALPSYRNGVWFVSLAGAGNGQGVVPLVAARWVFRNLRMSPWPTRSKRGCETASCCWCSTTVSRSWGRSHRLPTATSHAAPVCASWPRAARFSAYAASGRWAYRPSASRTIRR